jgi:UDP-N-acetylmuramate dehydrogenase
MIIEHKKYSALEKHTTFGLHAECEMFVECNTEQELIAAVRRTDLPKPLKLIGGGSNLLFAKPFEGTILWRRGSDVALTPEADGAVTVSAAAELDEVCRLMCQAGWWEFANLSGIPGSVGGAAVQNAGAYGVEMCNVVGRVRVYNSRTEAVETWALEDMRYAYRRSALKEPQNAGVYILSVTFAPKSRLTAPLLSYGRLAESVDIATLTPERLRETILKIRAEKLPDLAEVGCAGSFFRNPEVERELVPEGATAFPTADGLWKLSAAWLIDRAGLKGRRCGGAVVWQKQPLVIANPGFTATAADVVSLEEEIIAAVAKAYGITLTPEVEHL